MGLFRATRYVASLPQVSVEGLVADYGIETSFVDIHDLQGHNHAGKEKGQADDGQGIDPQMSHLRDRQAALNFGKLSQGLDE